MVAQAFNPRIWEAEAGGYLGVQDQPALSRKQAPRQSGLHSEQLSHIKGLPTGQGT